MRAAIVGTAALLALLVLAGCVSVPHSDLGQENGYSAGDSISVTTEDGLNESEREAVVSRTMARVERIRQLEFTETVPVEVISRAELRNRSIASGAPDPTNLSDEQLWNEQVWEALHIIGEDTTYPETRDTNRGSSVVGYYSPSNDQIVIVSDSPTPQIDRGTLAHELVHALQDQHLSTGGWPELQDEQLARLGVTEGDANYVEALYNSRCDRGEWSCIPRPDRGNRTRGEGFNQALFLTTLAPYAEGPYFVDTVRDRGGWAAVNRLYDDFPQSTEQIIHPERYPGDPPTEVSVPDRSNSRWNRFTDIGRPAYDTVGEASIYAMFQGNGLLGRTGSDQYNYDHPYSEGWAGDRLVPYRSADQYGYVWTTAWDAETEAREFADAYRDLLARQGSDSLGDGRFRIGSGPYADAFRVTRSGSRVTIVNAPTTAALDGVHSPG